MSRKASSFKPSNSVLPERFRSITKPSDFPIMPERFHSMRNAGQNANQKQYPQKALEEKMREMTEEMREELGRTPAFNDFIERLTRTYDKKKVEERLEAFAKAWIAVNGPIENIREVYNAHFSTMAYLMDTALVSDHQVTVGELEAVAQNQAIEQVIAHSNQDQLQEFWDEITNSEKMEEELKADNSEEIAEQEQEIEEGQEGYEEWTEEAPDEIDYDHPEKYL